MGLHLSGSSTTALNNAFVPRWQPSHAYLAGDIVMAPDGTIVSRISDGTSGSSYTGTNWTVVAGGATSLTSYATQVASLSDYPATFPSNALAVVTYAGDVGATRPGATVVVWQGFPTQPTNMADADFWSDTAGGAFLTGTATPPSGLGNDGDVYLRTSTSVLYGPKASGAWPAGVSLIGTNGRGVTSIARTSGTGAAGSTDTYTITYSDSTTSTFTVVNGTNGADGAGSSIVVQDEGTPLSTAATTVNFVGAGVTATGTGATKTVTIPGAGALAPTAKTTTYTAAANDLVLADASGGAFTVTLPTPTAGVRIGIKKTDSSANAVTVATTSGTIDGASTRTLPVQYASQVYVADGTNWFRLDVPGVTALAATGTPSSTTYLCGNGSWATPAGGSGSWQALTLNGSGVTATGCDAPAARLEGTDVVRLKGAMTNLTLTAGTFTSSGGGGTFAAPGTVMTTLPVGLRPSARRVIRSMGSTGSGTLEFVIETSGDMWPTAGIGTTVLVNFDGASFAL